MASESELKPSYFAELGIPRCSCFRKSELEWLSLDYIKALALSGDSWDVRISPREAVEALNGECVSYLRVMAKGFGNPAKWDVVASKLRSEQGARDVWSFSLMRAVKPRSGESGIKQ